MANPELSHKSGRSNGRDLGRLIFGCTLIGMVAGFGAAVFLIMLEAGTSFCLGYLAHYYPSTPGNEARLFEPAGGVDGLTPIRWMLLVLPIVGGLLSGIITFWLAPEAEGHGTDAAIEAYHFKDGAVRRRVPLVKAVTSMITIGTGGSGGREGPIAQIGAGFGSMLGKWLHVTPAERRVYMAAGMAGGIGAIFHAPLAGALFAAEVLYRGPDFEHELMIPGFIASIVAYSVFGSFFGFTPLFNTPGYEFSQVITLAPYLVLTVVAALGAMLYVKTFYGVRGLILERMPVPNHIKPAIGGVFVGAIGYFLPEALGTGYGVVQLCFDGNLGALPSMGGVEALLPVGTHPLRVAALLLFLIALGKVATTAFAIGTGGSGGVFGPAVVIGGALGGATGLILQDVFPGIGIEPGAFALVGMAGFFAGAANTPVSTIIMVSEMTGNYNLLVPSMLVCIGAYVLCRRFTLYEKQLPSRLHAPSKIGNMAIAILRHLTARGALELQQGRDVIVLHRDATFSELKHRFVSSTQDCFPIVDAQNRLTGMIRGEDIRRIIADTGMDNLIIAGDIEIPPVTVTAADSLLAAINRMVTTSSNELVVVDEEDPLKVVGTLSRREIVALYNRQVVRAAG